MPYASVGAPGKLYSCFHVSTSLGCRHPLGTRAVFLCGSCGSISHSDTLKVYAVAAHRVKQEQCCALRPPGNGSCPHSDSPLVVLADGAPTVPPCLTQAPLQTHLTPCVEAAALWVVM